jgi:uncharacterized membrane protein YczE
VISGALKRVLAPARTIPAMPWSAPRPGLLRPRLSTLVVLLFGLWLFGVGEAGLIDAKLGNTPWTVFAQGVADHSPLDIGGATILISVVVLLGWIPLRQRPGLGTLANVIVIGVSLDVMQGLLPHPGSVPGRSLEAAAAIVTIGIGSAFYLTANLGPGPRDGWMTGIHRRFGYPIASVRASIELTVLVIGIALGGRFGVATIAFALLVGYCLALTLQLFQARMTPAVDDVRKRGHDVTVSAPSSQKGESNEVALPPP